MSELIDIGVVLLDKRYNAEYVHELIRSASPMSIIPARGDNVPVWHTGGHYKVVV